MYYDVNGKATCLDTNVYDLESLKAGVKVNGPAIILNQTSTILVEPSYEAVIDDFGNVIITVTEDGSKGKAIDQYKSTEEVPLNAIELSIFGHRFMSIAE